MIVNIFSSLAELEKRLKITPFCLTFLSISIIGGVKSTLETFIS